MGAKIYSIVGLGIFLLLLNACVKDKPDAMPNPNPNYTLSGKVYVVCEGAYGNGNAALGLYIPTKDSFFTDVYRTANAQSLGDVLQSITRMGNYLLLAVNNSNNITVLPIAPLN